MTFLIAAGSFFAGLALGLIVNKWHSQAPIEPPENLDEYWP